MQVIYHKLACSGSVTVAEDCYITQAIVQAKPPVNVVIQPAPAVAIDVI